MLYYYVTCKHFVKNLFWSQRSPKAFHMNHRIDFFAIIIIYYTYFNHRMWGSKQCCNCSTSDVFVGAGRAGRRRPRSRATRSWRGHLPRGRRNGPQFHERRSLPQSSYFTVFASFHSARRRWRRSPARRVTPNGLGPVSHTGWQWIVYGVHSLSVREVCEAQFGHLRLLRGELPSGSVLCPRVPEFDSW